PFPVELDGERTDPSDIPPRPSEALNETVPDGFGRGREHDRDRGGGPLRDHRRHRAPRRDEELHGLAHKLTRERGESLESVVSPAVLDRHVLAVDVSRLLQSPKKCVAMRAGGREGVATEEADYGLLRLLRPGGERRGKNEHGYHQAELSHRRRHG